MKLLAVAVALFAMAAPVKSVQLAIVHAVRGCHIWQAKGVTGPAVVIKLTHGGRIQLRVSCPMDFRLVKLRGPAVAIGDSTFHTGTMRTLVFPRRGTYVFSATNLESSEQMGLQTLGTDNVLKLTVVVT
jgi:hypothetical protein